MESLIYLDTHVVVWLYLHGAEVEFGPGAMAALRTAQDVRVSPAVRLELQFLREIERIRVGPTEVLDELGGRMGLVECGSPFAAVVAAATSIPWTRDPFDRLIVGHARLNEAGLVTRDREIRKHYSKAIW